MTGRHLFLPTVLMTLGMLGVEAQAEDAEVSVSVERVSSDGGVHTLVVDVDARNELFQRTSPEAQLAVSTAVGPNVEIDADVVVSAKGSWTSGVTQLVALRPVDVGYSLLTVTVEVLDEAGNRRLGRFRFGLELTSGRVLNLQQYMEAIYRVDRVAPIRSDPNANLEPGDTPGVGHGGGCHSTTDLCVGEVAR